MRENRSLPVAVVICPMEIERSAVSRSLRRVHVEGVEVIRCGIGREAITGAVERVARASRAEHPTTAHAHQREGADEAIDARLQLSTRHPLIILAGACGALREVDDVPPIARVIDEHGGCWDDGMGMDPSGVTLIAVDRVISTPEAKAHLARASGAAVVDMESHAFAATCRRHALPWAVVRGVSDAPHEVLPEEVLRWIAPDGRTRTWRALADLARRPSLIPHMRGVLARSRRVLPRVGERTVEVALAWRRETASASFSLLARSQASTEADR